jgi:hypothetical protein
VDGGDGNIMHETVLEIMRQAPTSLAETLGQTARATDESVASDDSEMSAFSTTSSRNVRWRSNIRACPTSSPGSCPGRAKL